MRVNVASNPNVATSTRVNAKMVLSPMTLDKTKKPFDKNTKVILAPITALSCKSKGDTDDLQVFMVKAKAVRKEEKEDDFIPQVADKDITLMVRLEFTDTKMKPLAGMESDRFSVFLPECLQSM